MNDVKVNLTIALPGRTMLSKQECLKQLKTPKVIKKGKYAGQQMRDKEGNLLYVYKNVLDLDKHDAQSVKVKVLNPDTDKMESEVIHFFTRKCIPATQTINISLEAYNYYISDEVPFDFVAPETFKGKGASRNKSAWKRMNKKERLEWHLKEISASREGTMMSYIIFND